MGLRNKERGGDHREVCEFLSERVSEMKAMSWEDLDRYGQRTDTFHACSGGTYRVVSIARREVSSQIDIEVWGYAEQAGEDGLPTFRAALLFARTIPTPTRTRNRNDGFWAAGDRYGATRGRASRTMHNGVPRRALRSSAPPAHGREA